MKKTPESVVSPHPSVMEQMVEELRDLVSTVEWLLEAEPGDPRVDFERWLARERVRTAKELLTGLDGSGGAYG